MNCKLPESELRSTRLLMPVATERLASLDSLAVWMNQAGLTMTINYVERQYYHVPVAAFYHDGEQVARWWPMNGKGFLGHPTGPVTKFETKRADRAVALAIGAIGRKRSANKAG